MRNDDESLQNVSGLSFRNLVESLEQEDSDDETLTLLPQDGSLQSRFQFFAYRIFQRMKKRGAKTSSFVSFAFDLFVYLAVRLRVLMILVAVAAEVVSSYTDNLKKFLIKNMFWGRGNLFKLSVQFVSVIVVVVLTFSSVYRVQPISAQFEGGVGNAAQTDVLALKGSTTTQKPENRLSTESTNYVVKVGDTISSIAESQGRSIDTILWANNLTESSLIRPGQELVIPPGDGVMVEVKDGDTVNSLAEKYNSNSQLIIENNLDLVPPAFELRAGMNVFIPDGRPPAPPKPATPTYSGVVATTPTVSRSPVVSGVGRFLGWPVAGGRGTVSQCYSGWHNGIDIYDAGYPNLVAAGAGQVTFAGCQSGSCPGLGLKSYGGWGLAWTVMINHGNGLTTVYGHMDQIYVKSGQFVAAGQAIGQMGNSGYASGPHVHFMILSGGNWRGLNPAPYMQTSICGY